MMVHVYNPSAQRLRQEDFNFEAALGDTVRLFHKKQNKTKQPKPCQPKTNYTGNIQALTL